LGKLNQQIPSLTNQATSEISVPVLVELCLQTAGIWEIGKAETLSLPKSIGTLRLFENKVNGKPIFAEVNPMKAENGDLFFNARVVDGEGQVYLEIDEYRTAQMPYGIEADLLKPIKELVK
jgi:hypothetical protein